MSDPESRRATPSTWDKKGLQSSGLSLSPQLLQLYHSFKAYRRCRRPSHQRAQHWAGSSCPRGTVDSIKIPVLALGHTKTIVLLLIVTPEVTSTADNRVINPDNDTLLLSRSRAEQTGRQGGGGLCGAIPFGLQATWTCPWLTHEQDRCRVEGSRSKAEAWRPGGDLGNT